ncbi:hypothetical protein ACWDA9_41615, partial [Streptomyces sp. NPDC001193]
MAFGFAPPSTSSLTTAAGGTSRHGRLLEPSEWTAAGIPLLRNPRESPRTGVTSTVSADHGTDVEWGYRS